MSNKQNKRFQSHIPYNDWELVYFDLVNLLLSNFTFENLPETIDECYLKFRLFENGSFVFFEDDIVGYLATGYTQNGSLNFYGRPKTVSPMAIGKVFKEVNVDILDEKQNAVIVYNNLTRTGEQKILTDYAKKIALVNKTIDLNINAQKTPYIVATSKNSEFTMKKLYDEVESFKPAIFVDDKNNTLSFDDLIKVYGLNTPFIADKLEDYERRLYAKIYNFMGIETSNVDKGERITATEVVASNGITNAHRNTRMLELNKGIERINKIFNLNIKVIENVNFSPNELYDDSLKDEVLLNE